MAHIVHHPLLSDGEWKTQLPQRINEIVAIKERLQSSREIQPADVSELGTQLQIFLNCIDDILKELADYKA